MLRLTPRVDDANYEWLTLAVDRVSLSITQMIATDFQGGVSTFTFTNLKENGDLSDRLFTFEIPRGTEVVTADTF
jgi:outer membrane lipoprotein-sorting protein